MLEYEKSIAPGSVTFPYKDPLSAMGFLYRLKPRVFCLVSWPLSLEREIQIFSPFVHFLCFFLDLIRFSEVDHMRSLNKKAEFVPDHLESRR